MKKNWLALLLTGVLLTGLVTGCAVRERSYTSVTTHVNQTVSKEDPDVLRAEDYQALVDGILHFVTQRAEEGTIRLYQYTGDVERDLEEACREILKEDPLGCYALSGLEHSYSRIVSYYECTFQFQYRPNREDPNSVTAAGSWVSLRQQIHTAMDSFRDAVAFRVHFDVSAEEVSQVVESYYDSKPGQALGRPQVYVNKFPQEREGQQIVEVRFYYPETAADSPVEKSAQAAELAGELVKELAPDETGLAELHEKLSRSMNLDENGSDSVYDWLAARSGSSESAAMAVQLCCRLLDVPSLLVTGTRDGRTHWWNVVCLEEVWYHFDVTETAEEELLRSDREQEIRCTWDRDLIPPCGPEEEEEETPAPEPQPTPAPQPSEPPAVNTPEPSPSPEPTAEPTPEPSPEPTEEPSPEPTESPEPEESPSPAPEPGAAG